MAVDVPRKRIGLSMRLADPAEQREARAGAHGEPKRNNTPREARSRRQQRPRRNDAKQPSDAPLKPKAPQQPGTMADAFARARKK
jgi:transcriptional accessory protein Tex/SPT6